MGQILKNFQFLIFFLISSSIWSIEIDWYKIEKKEGLYYEKSRKNKFTGKTIKAIIPVHVFGHPCNIRDIIKISNILTQKNYL